MQIVNYILDNFVMLFELLGLTVLLHISVHLNSKLKFNVRFVVILIFIISIVSYVELHIRDDAGMALTRHFLTALKYTLYPILIISLLPISYPYKKKMPAIFITLILLPEIISIPFYMSSQWTHLIYYIGQSDVNYYVAGPLQYWPYFIFFFYMIIFIVFNILRLKKFSMINQRISLFIILGATAGIILYLIYEREEDYTPVVTAALILYFIFLYIHLACKDALTGLLNRQYYYKDMKENVYAVISIDMNDLKYINDTFGHDVGDLGLVKMSEIIISQLNHKMRAYRVGGDEFIIFFFYPVSEKEIVNKIEKMKNMLKGTQNSYAFGYSIKRDDIKIDKMIEDADFKMYQDKSEYKRIRNSVAASMVRR